MLYEDVPYSRLAFLRAQFYRALLQRVKLDDVSLARAFRLAGLTILAYIRGRNVPFPRGKKLFVAIGIIVSLQNLLSKTRGHEQAYAGSISVFDLTAEDALKKWALLQHY